MIQFCPVCRKILQIKEEDGKSVGFCSCGFKRVGYELSASEKGEDKVITIGEGVVENDESNKIEKLSYADKKDMKPDF
ncbi:MAG: hypothetical protein WC979_07050 [Candidatus Pacearchaeota archaeon]|jgi:hypothetical protein